MVCLFVIIGLPVTSLIIRFYFELFTVPFAVSKNIARIRRGLFGCKYEGCSDAHESGEVDLKEHTEEPKPVVPVKVAPAKPVPAKPVPVKTASAKPTSAKTTPAKKAPVKTTIAKKPASKKK